MIYNRQETKSKSVYPSLFLFDFLLRLPLSEKKKTNKISDLIHRPPLFKSSTEGLMMNWTPSLTSCSFCCSVSCTGRCCCSGSLISPLYSPTMSFASTNLIPPPGKKLKRQSTFLSFKGSPTYLIARPAGDAPGHALRQSGPSCLLFSLWASRDSHGGGASRCDILARPSLQTGLSPAEFLSLLTQSMLPKDRLPCCRYSCQTRRSNRRY